MAAAAQYIAAVTLCLFAFWIFGAGSVGYLNNILRHPLIQCRLKGGTCININNCNTTVNIYKDICKSYNYHDVCCISRETVCHKFSGFCTNSSDFCITAGKLFRGGYGYHKPVVLSWLACNETHRCCHPLNTKRRKKGHGHGGGYGHGHGGGYGHGHGGGYGHLQDEGHYQGGHGGYGHGGGHGGGGYGYHK